MLLFFVFFLISDFFWSASSEEKTVEQEKIFFVKKFTGKKYQIEFATPPQEILMEKMVIYTSVFEEKTYCLLYCPVNIFAYMELNNAYLEATLYLARHFPDAKKIQIAFQIEDTGIFCLILQNGSAAEFAKFRASFLPVKKLPE